MERVGPRNGVVVEQPEEVVIEVFGVLNGVLVLVGLVLVGLVGIGRGLVLGFFAGSIVIRAL